MTGPRTELAAAAGAVAGPWASSLSALLLALADNAPLYYEVGMSREMEAALRLAADIRASAVPDVPQFTGNDVKQVNDLLRTVITNLVSTLESELARAEAAS